MQLAWDSDASTASRWASKASPGNRGSDCAYVAAFEPVLGHQDGPPTATAIPG